MWYFLLHMPSVALANIVKVHWATGLLGKVIIQMSSSPTLEKALPVATRASECVCMSLCVCVCVCRCV